jgi:hypothetical protein
VLSGEPWELSELPRQMYPDPDSVTFSSPPARKRAQKPKKSNLDTISERPSPYQQHSSQHSTHPLAQSSVPRHAVDASTSTTDLGRGSVDGESDESAGSGSSAPRKVQKGQINALAKMLSALRR